MMRTRLYSDSAKLNQGEPIPDICVVTIVPYLIRRAQFWKWRLVLTSSGHVLVRRRAIR